MASFAVQGDAVASQETPEFLTTPAANAVPLADSAGKIASSWITGLTIAPAKTLTVNNSLALAGTDGKSLTLTGGLTVGADTTIAGGGTLGLGGFTLTVPATGTAALLEAANVFTAAQTISTSAVPLVLLRTTSTVGNAVVSSLFFRRSHTTAPSNGFGLRHQFQLKTTTAEDVNAGGFDVLWANATGGSHAARMRLLVDDFGATREFIRGEADGTQPLLGFYGAAAAARQTVAGSRGGNTALASLLTALATIGLITNSSTA
ncbi:MAG TPA: hypothetical protein VER55_06175 [Ardenticatenaceae bacterium]|nr:hypothetical protein [Ardenticatenaceae bacterium]